MPRLGMLMLSIAACGVLLCIAMNQRQRHPRLEATMVQREEMAFVQGISIAQTIVICQFLDRLQQKTARPLAAVELWPDLSQERIDALFRARGQLKGPAPDCDAIRQVLVQETTP